MRVRKWDGLQDAADRVPEARVAETASLLSVPGRVAEMVTRLSAGTRKRLDRGSTTATNRGTTTPTTTNKYYHKQGHHNPHNN